MAQQPSASAGAPPASPAPGADASAADHAAADIAIDAAYLAYGRAVWIGVVSGVAVGFLLGFVNRLIMRIVAVMNGPTPIETDFGAKVLNFTVEGTMFLIVTTVIVSIVPGALYMVLRRLFPSGALASGLVFAVLLLAVAGTSIIDAQARDFRLLGEPMVSAAMFIGLFFAFGLLVAMLATRLDQRVSREPTDRVSALYAGAGGLILILALPILFSGPWALLLLAPICYVFAVSFWPSTVHRRAIRLGGYVALAVPIVPGLIDLGQELSLIALA